MNGVIMVQCIVNFYQGTPNRRNCNKKK